MESYSYQLTSMSEVAPHVFELVVDPVGEALPYQAGQYVEFLYPDGNYYPFSVANSPKGSGTLEFYVRIVQEDIALQHFFLALEQNPEFELRGPLGSAIYQPTPDKKIIMLAGGTGIAPMKSMIETSDGQDDIYLFWGAQSPTEFFLQDYFISLQRGDQLAQFVPAVSGHEPWGGETGWIHQVVMDYFTDFNNCVVYASGPFEMVSDAHDLFQRHGLNAHDFYSDML